MILVVINKLIKSLWSGTWDGNDSLVTRAQIWSQFFIFHHFNKVLFTDVSAHIKCKCHVKCLQKNYTQIHS